MRYVGLFIVLISFWSSVSAQIIEIPIHRNGESNLRTKDTGPIDLPFWDDFSTSNGVPDSSVWLSSASGVIVSPGVGINAPTFNVAVLDGWDADGVAYNANPVFEGKTDSLMSRPIRLADVSSSLQNTIYLTFYYQEQGNGELPDEPQDSLILRFKLPDGSWNTVWPLPDESIVRDPEVFTKKTLKIEPEYISNDFQFMFQAYGRLNGPFDTWNIDYVFLDKNRSEVANDAPDRGFTQPPSSILGQYTALPIEHFLQDPKKFLSIAESGIRNLEDKVQPVEYNVFLEDDESGNVIDQIMVDSAFIALTRPFDFRVLPTNIPDSAKVVEFLTDKDSARLRTRYEMDSGDQFLIDEVINSGQDTIFYENFDLRVNDTTSSVVVLKDYYAYDDGSAEFGAGINQLSGQVAVQFIPEQPGYITSVDAYFPNIDKNQSGLPIEILILSAPSDEEVDILGSATYSVSNNGIDVFTTYTLPIAVEVVDTFYVSIRQGTNDFLAIGLDKNTDTSNKIWFNVVGIWEKNETTTGSLMIRPRFGEANVTSIEDEQLPKPYRFYPNPVNDQLNIEGENIEMIQILDISGRRILSKGSPGRIDLSNFQSGTYILQILSGDQWYSERIVKQ